MILNEVILGHEYKDVVTGLQGICVAKTEWLNGCGRAILQPRGVKEGKTAEGTSVDVEQLKFISVGVTKQLAKKAPTGGPYPEPKRSLDPIRR